MQVNVLGYGVMGRQIASLFCLAGYEVNVWDCVPMQLSLVQRETRIAKRFYPTFREGTIRTEEDFQRLPNCVTVEAIVEDLPAKKSLYERYRSKNGGAYYSNTSSYTPAEIGEQVKGLHFFNPVIRIKLIEYIDEDNLDSIRPMLEFAENNGVTFVRVNENRGYIGNFLLFHEISNVFTLIETYRYGPEEIGDVYRSLFPDRNVFEIVDLIGVDVCQQILTNLQRDNPGIHVPELFGKALEMGILGKKNHTSIEQVLK